VPRVHARELLLARCARGCVVRGGSVGGEPEPTSFQRAKGRARPRARLEPDGPSEAHAVKDLAWRAQRASRDAAGREARGPRRLDGHDVTAADHVKPLWTRRDARGMDEAVLCPAQQDGFGRSTASDADQVRWNATLSARRQRWKPTERAPFARSDVARGLMSRRPPPVICTRTCSEGDRLGVHGGKDRHGTSAAQRRTRAR